MKRTSAFALLMILSLCGCAAVEVPTGDPTTAEPSPSPTSATATPSASPPEAPAAENVTFTFECGFYAADGTAVRIADEFLSFEDSWAHEPATAWCLPIQHGTEYTAIQHEAVALAGDVLSDGIEQVGGLYAHCAIRADPYLQLPSLAPNQAQEVRGFLHICPDRPGADHLRTMLGG